ncbi:MAG TPA: radical SAM protein [Methanosarcina sp.]|jgi:uncharacterized protein
MNLNRLLHFIETDNGNNYIFNGNDGELYKIGKKAYLLLFSTYDELLTSDQNFSTSYFHDKVANLVPGIDLSILDEIFFTDDEPPVLKNELDNDIYFKKSQLQFSGFFIFPTYKCNLNCAYCTYSGIYPKERHHEPISISSELINDVTYYIRKASSECEKVNIVFYGDEPLMNFQGVRLMIKTLEAYEGKKYSFQIVTNGLLLNKYIVDFFANKRIKMQISLDGPPHIHNRYRRTPDGRATHQLVIEKLELIRDMDLDYYNNCIGLSCTLAPPFHIDEVDQYFRKNSLFSNFSGHKGNFSISIMNMEGTDFYSEADKITFRKQMQPFKEAYIEYLLTGEKEKTQFIPSAMYEAPFYAFAKKCINKDDKWSHSGECIPGINGAAIGADGKLFVCNTFNRDPIGSVQNGIEREKVRFLRQAYLEVRNSVCRNCWLYRFCPVCIAAFKYAEHGQNFTEILDCTYTKAMAEDLLKMYILTTSQAPQGLIEFLSR